MRHEENSKAEREPQRTPETRTESMLTSTTLQPFQAGAHLMWSMERDGWRKRPTGRRGSREGATPQPRVSFEREERGNGRRTSSHLGDGGKGGSGGDVSRSRAGEFGLEVLHCLADPCVEVHDGLPAKPGAGACDIRLTLVRVIHRRGEVDDADGAVDVLLDVPCEGQDTGLDGVANVGGEVGVAVHQLVQPLDQVADILEGTCLTPVSVDGDGGATEGLGDEVADDAAVVGVHSRPEGVEDPGDANGDVLLLLVRIHHRLGDALPLVVAGPRPDGVHVAPVVLFLRVHLGVPVDLRRAGQQHPRLHMAGEAEEVEGPEGAGLDGLDGVVLVVLRGCRARQVVDLVALEEEGPSDVVVHQLEVRVTDPMLHVPPPPGEEVVNDHDVMALHHELIHQVGAHKPRAARDEDAFAEGEREVLDEGVALGGARRGS